mmetsp:Transcript_807/g.1935  ORF Transcript_807/g.1935 Transcript_807/m.1935 type:complete len:219 (-) Transcript_807:79-735(-)|eukprot:CAMPEP_0172459694 /NCGR_PEP_ID=MMETSP1065-20121228/33735_1 /TAXON_ID=265537 /ORGANISM="Amphiprora paludosa, Strain CCMP125" /LENGTH=218 /DNA_ID=CAMNT_0013214463 /DNA_START=155 /DNA_END=811 /DNA_ORIENTATION=-
MAAAKKQMNKALKMTAPILRRMGSKRSLGKFCCNEDIMTDGESSSLSGSSYTTEGPSHPLASSRTAPRRPRIVRLRSAKNVFSLGDDFVPNENKEALQSIRQAIEALTEQQQDVCKGAMEHLDKAKARFDSHNDKGAILSMRRVHKLQAEQTKFLQASGYLRTLESELEAKSTRGRRHPSPKYTRFSKHVDHILCDKKEHKDVNDQTILSELQSLTQP